ncbi:MAG: CHRD domain-containing protein [Vicinamibacterales bacterium]
MLRRGFLVLMLAVAAAGCDNDSPTAPADPNVVVFTAQLSAANEVPAITNAEAAARGNVRISVNLSRDAGNNITGATYNFVVNLNSFPPGSTWTLAHIHEGAAGVAGGVRVNTGLSSATAIALTDGSITGQTFSNIPFNPTVNPNAIDLINQMITNPNGFYFNVHSSLNGGGAVRGQLAKQ